MEIFYSKDNPIRNLEDWSKLHSEKHWKVGNSAYELAKFILEGSGIEYISGIINQILDKEVRLEKATPEYNVNLDNWGSGRKHDLAILGKLSEGNTTKDVFIGIEAKVNESFGQTIGKTYMNGVINQINGKNSNIPKRVSELLKHTFTTINSEHLKLRYQLLYSLVGTINENADIHIFMVLSFKPKIKDKRKIDNNLQDFEKFMKAMNAEIKTIGEKRYYKTTIKKGEGVSKEINAIYVSINQPTI